MNVVYLIGRILLVALFLYAGVGKILDISGTSELISAKLVIPAALDPLLAKAGAIANMTVPHLLALTVGIIEIVFSLFIIFGIAARFSAAVLLVYVGAVIFYGHPFWSVAADMRAAEINDALHRLPIIGGLLIILAVGPWVTMHDEVGPVVPAGRDPRL
jgi:putative oxidoreductase